MATGDHMKRNSDKKRDFFGWEHNMQIGHTIIGAYYYWLFLLMIFFIYFAD